MPERPCFAYLFEAKGLQKYIFDSGPLRDIIGASDQIAELVTMNVSWRDDPDGIASASEHVVEVSRDLIGRVAGALDQESVQFSRRAGGAFCIHSADRDRLVQLRALWRLAVMLRLPGLEAAESLTQEPCDDDLDAMRLAYSAGPTLRENSAAEAPPVGGPSTTFVPRTGRPATAVFVYPKSDRSETDVVLSDVVTTPHRRRAEALRGKIDGVAARFLGINEKDADGISFVFPRNFEPREGDTADNPLFPFRAEQSRVAVVHADVSGLGEAYAAAKPRSVGANLELAAAIERIIEGAAQRATEGVLLEAAETAHYGRADEIETTLRLIPARPVVLGGDDITIIVRADLALDFAARLLAEIETLSETILSDVVDAAPPERVSACAGVAIVPRAHPFLMACDLATELCDFAKATAKESHETAPYPSALAFHYSTSTLAESYDAILEGECTAGDTRLSANPYGVGKMADQLSSPSWTGLVELAKEIAKVPGAAGALRQLRTLWFGDLAARDAAWGRWREVLRERKPAALESIDAAFADLGFRASESSPPVQSGRTVIFDALDLIDCQCVESEDEGT